MSHNGYAIRHGIVHRRRIYVNASGLDIRGEDTLDGKGDHKFTIRFHLHPAVKASLVQGGASVLLRLPNKTGWRMRCAGGIARSAAGGAAADLWRGHAGRWQWRSTQIPRRSLAAAGRDHAICRWRCNTGGAGIVRHPLMARL